MKKQYEAALDISEFRCTRATNVAVSVVFGQTGREYTFAWDDAELNLARPTIVGGCGLHPPEILDCLARAIAYQASQKIPPEQVIVSHVKINSSRLKSFFFGWTGATAW